MNVIPIEKKMSQDHFQNLMGYKGTVTPKGPQFGGPFGCPFGGPYTFSQIICLLRISASAEGIITA